MTRTDLFKDGKLVGKKYKISKAIYHDRGVYICKTENPFGVMTSRFHLKVSKNVIRVHS